MKEEVKVKVEADDLEKLIKKGLKYIGFEGLKYNEYDHKDCIKFDLVIDIRKFLFNKPPEWYSEKFSKAYDYDIGLTREKDDGYYSNDGIKYKFDDDMNLIEYFLYKGKTWQTFEKPKKWLFHYHLGNYYYINEIDHFFTKCINNYLLNIGVTFSQEKGLKLIYETIAKIEEDQ